MKETYKEDLEGVWPHIQSTFRVSEPNPTNKRSAYGGLRHPRATEY